MIRNDLVPDVHVFVCANRREATSPLGAGCAERGDAVYDAMKKEVARRGAFRSVWVTRTHCIGVCPQRGATVAVYPARKIYSEVDAADAAALLSAAIDGRLP